jgi:hypothetical protein
MADNPYALGAAMMNPNVARTGMYDMRMMSAANRSEAPFEHIRSGARRSGAGEMIGQMAATPDYSQFTFDPAANAAARQALSPYGLAPLEASQVKQNQILPNTGFFGNHPRLSGAIEGGLFSAMAAHGGDTPGESIQGALEGVVGGRQMKQNLYNRQFQAPFQAAGMFEALSDAQQKRELQSADIEHLRALNEHLKNGDFEKAQTLMETNRHNEAMEAYRNQQIESTAPRNLGEGRIGVYHGENIPPEGKSVDPNKPLWEIQQDPEWEKQRAEDRRLARQGASQAGMLKGEVTEKDPKTGQPRKRYVQLAPGQVEPEGFQGFNATYEQKQGDKGEDKRKAYLAKPRKASELMQMGYQGDLTDGNAKTKFLGDFYDKNIAPNVPESNSGGYRRNPDGSISEQ